jgi:hypothetical protein
MRSVSLVLSLALVMSGCSDTLSPLALAGRWSELFMAGGFNLNMTLVPIGKNLTGNGDFCVELGGCGTVKVIGAVSGDAVHIDISYQCLAGCLSNQGFTQRFDGHLVSGNRLVGSVIGEVAGQRTQGPDSVTYQRS